MIVDIANKRDANSRGESPKLSQACVIVKEFTNIFHTKNVKLSTKITK